MSRIYEALRRADLERKAQLGTELHPVEDAKASVEFVEHPPALTEAMTGDVTEYPWKPVTDSIPCLLERGTVIEQFRRLRSKLTQARQEAAIKSVLISSGMPSEGKTFVTLNLAVSLAREGVNRVLLIDGDLRRPTLHTILGAPNQPGLSEYLAGTAESSAILQQNKVAEKDGSPYGHVFENLTLIPSGACGDVSSELVTNGRMENLLATLAPHFDWILIDSPPVLAVTDAVDMARACDAVLLVAREARTPYEVAQRAQASFRQSRLLGVVLNAAKHIQRNGYSYYDYYYGASDAGAHPGRRKGARGKA
ncbi:MAG TPA: CpsD/CapB family tyrosine-protein kinase [Terracidiphilus sp.]|nr:CpsD/CapB family tyrosine-protein kinase [Terracidiphilus sp.]